jgi:Coatomer WD associated region
MSIFAYSLSLAVVEYQTAILRRDFAASAELLNAVPVSERNKVARFLEAQGTHKHSLYLHRPDVRFIGMQTSKPWR